MRQPEPAWVTELLLQVCKDEKRDIRKKPSIRWIHRTGWKHRGSTSGNYGFGQITIMTEPNAEHQKEVFLHEVAHWLVPETKTNRALHGKRFYKKLRTLLERYDCLTQSYREREAEYMKRSVYYL